ncbi:unannotated protein [freshwater metagenome]|uniref:Unannotated protein n=1 Tax=freshwater metagenome TaxID=449393 RepID=A0A6J7D1M3_9ZZZZ|nr:phosphatidylglycerol lysyltransferase domain-containing protein [Actinomycetota bacterium]
MSSLSNEVIALPQGRRLTVYSDLQLSPEMVHGSIAMTSIVEQLNEIDEATVIIFAGSTFAFGPTTNPQRFVAACWQRFPAFYQALQRIASLEQARVIFLPGATDEELGTDAPTQDALTRMGFTLATAVSVNVMTWRGSRRLEVVAGATRRDTARVDDREREDARRLDDTQSLTRFVQSRLMYRTFSAWAWAPLWIFAFLMLSSFVIGLNDLFGSHGSQLLGQTPHFTTWGWLSASLFAVAAIEAILVVIASTIARRRFFYRDGGQFTSSEPLGDVLIGNQDALKLASTIVAAGGVGLIVGGCARPALAYLDQGVCAAPGPSGRVFVERLGRFGLPPIFQPVARTSYVEVEAGGTVRVRLVAGGLREPSTTRLERWLAGKTTLPAPPELPALIGSWPDGSPWPQTPIFQQTFRRELRLKRIVSGVVLLTGLANVVSAVVPPARGRLESLLHVLPLGVAQSAAAATALAGVGMIMMARGLRRGQRRAWIVAAILFAITTTTHVVHGGNGLGTLINAIVLILLITERRIFQGATDRGSFSGALPKLLSIPAVATASAMLVVIVTSRIPFGREWWHIAQACVERLVGVTRLPLPDRAGDFLSPSLFATGIVIIMGSLYLLTRPVVDRRLSNHGSSAERRLAELRARDIVRRHGRGTLDYFALRDDKQFFFFRDSLVAYAVYGGVALISPDPIGPEPERVEVFAAFRRFAEQRGWTLAIIGAGQQWLPVYQGAGLHHIYVGDEGVVNCQTFSLEGGKMKGLRQACTRLARNGYSVEFVDPSTIDPARVRGIMELIAKLRRGEDERGFSMMLGRLFNPRDKGLLLTIVNGPDGTPAAVCQFVPSPAINGYSLDLMRRDPGEHPNGLIDFALCSTIEHLRQEGGQGLSLNFAAFRSVLDGEKGDGTFTKVERWALKRLSGILPIETLWTFNAKYQPDWLPRYLVYPAFESLVPVVAALLRAESLTEIPVIGRLLANDPSNRPSTVIPEEILAAASENAT